MFATATSTIQEDSIAAIVVLCTYLFICLTFSFCVIMAGHTWLPRVFKRFARRYEQEHASDRDFPLGPRLFGGWIVTVIINVIVLDTMASAHYQNTVNALTSTVARIAIGFSFVLVTVITFANMITILSINACRRQERQRRLERLSRH